VDDACDSPWKGCFIASALLGCQAFPHWGRCGRVILVSAFCTGKIYGGKDHVFLFQGGLANYEEPQSTL
jgi:hypothetical protein